MPTAFSSLGSDAAQPLPVVPGTTSVEASPEGAAALAGADELAATVADASISLTTLSAVPAAGVAAQTGIQKASAAQTGVARPHVAAVDPQQPLHRIAEVRKQQGISLRTVSRRTGIEVKELRHQEQDTTDLVLSQLRKWQQALEVPLADLIEDDQALSRPVRERAKLVRIMKTAVSLRDACQGNVRMERMVAMLCEQLLDLMPELEEVGSWPQSGSRRGADVMGKIFLEPITVDPQALD
jgi:transcriptional regulator with XRE-family HTH domain